MDIDKKTIYQNLRGEIIDLAKRQDNYLLASYTICITIWAFSLETLNEWVAILPMFILIPLSLRVCDFRYGTVFLSAFMAVFLEEKSYEGWEYVREEYYKTKSEFNANKSNLSYENKKLFKRRSLPLSFLSRGTFCLLTVISVVIFWGIRGFKFETLNQIIVAVIICSIQLIVLGLQGYVAYKYRDTTTIKKPLLEDWEYVYNKLYTEKANNQNGETNEEL